MPLDDLITAVLNLLSKTGGVETIARMFDENGITVDKVVAETAKLPGPVLDTPPGDY